MKNINNSAGGSTWLIALLIYFTLFLGVTISANFNSPGDITDYSSSVGDLVDLSSEGACVGPRTLYDAKTGAVISNEIGDAAQQQLSCSLTSGILNNGTTCNNIQGCNWEEVTTGFLWWTETGYSCAGDINGTYYGINTLTVLGTTIYNPGGITFGSYSVCNDPAINTQEECSAFDCTWYGKGTYQFYEAVEENKNAKETINTLQKIMKVRYTFDTGNGTVDFLLNIIFIVIPLVMLIIAIWLVFNPVK